MLDDNVIIAACLFVSALLHIVQLGQLYRKIMDRDFWKREAESRSKWLADTEKHLSNVNTELRHEMSESKHFYNMAQAYYNRILVLEDELKRYNIPLPGWEVEQLEQWLGFATDDQAQNQPLAPIPLE